MKNVRSALRMFSVATALGGFAGGLAWAQAAALAKLVPAQSEIVFQIKQSGVPVEGRFRKFDAQLALDPKAPQAGKVSLAIDTGSASVGFAETDAELPRAPWFNAAKFPQAVFQSSAIQSNGPGKLQVTGKLTIKGSLHDVVVPVALAQSGANTTATGEFTVKRLDFKIGEGEWTDVSLIANDVRVRFKLVFTGLGRL